MSCALAAAHVSLYSFCIHNSNECSGRWVRMQFSIHRHALYRQRLCSRSLNKMCCTSARPKAQTFVRMYTRVTDVAVDVYLLLSFM